MGKVNMVASISRSYHHGVLFKRHLLEMRGEQRESPAGNAVRRRLPALAGRPITRDFFPQKNTQLS